MKKLATLLYFILFDAAFLFGLIAWGDEMDVGCISLFVGCIALFTWGIIEAIKKLIK